MAKVVAEVAEGFDGAHGVFISGGNQRGKRGIVCNGAQQKPVFCSRQYTGTLP
jgi:hypothetical protein